MATTWDSEQLDPLEVDQLPPFASDENKQLEKEIKESQRELLKYERDVEENQRRVVDMKEHFKNVQSEFVNIQGLLSSKVKDLQSEKHLKQLSDREMGKIKVEISKIVSEQSEFQNKANSIQNAILKAKQKLENFKEIMNLNSEQLQQWAIARQQKEEDVIALQKYSRADEATIKELNLQAEKLMKELRSVSVKLEEEVTETRAAQIELDKTAVEFKNLHREKQDVLKQWEEAINNMERLDKSIQQANDILKEIGEKQLVIQDKKKFLEREQANNREVEQQISASDRLITKLRADLADSQNGITEFEGELETVKNTLTKTAMTLETKKAEITQFKKDIITKQLRIEKLQILKQQTQDNLKNHFQATDDLDAKAKQLDIYYRNEENKLSKAETELATVQQELFKESQELYKLRQEEQNLVSDINGARAAAKNLQAKITKLDAESLKQQEIIYNQEFALQQLERKISRAQGERSNEEKQILTGKIKELSTQLDAQNELYNLLTNQQKKIDEDNRAARRKLDAYKIEKESLAIKINEIMVENETAMKSLRSTIKRKEELLVSENFVRLDVKRLRDLLYKKADQVYTLENRKYQLQLSMEERRAEISVHKEVLRAQLRIAKEEKASRAKELGEKLMRVEKLRKKYQTLSLRFQNQNEEGSNEEHTQAYFIIKAAQRKEELIKQKEELEVIEKQARSEIMSLQTSLASFNALNQRLHGQKTRGNLTASDFEESSRLEVTLKNIQVSQREKIAKLEKVGNILAAMQNTEQELSNEKDSLLQDIAEINSKKTTLDVDIEDLKLKNQRALSQLSKIIKQTKSKSSENEETVIEINMRLEQFRTFNFHSVYFISMILNNLITLNQHSPKISSEIVQFLEKAQKSFAEAGITIPDPTSHPPTPTSSKSGFSRTQSRTSSQSRMSTASASQIKEMRSSSSSKLPKISSAQIQPLNSVSSPLSPKPNSSQSFRSSTSRSSVGSSSEIGLGNSVKRTGVPK